VIGINTARAGTFKGGRINSDQIESIRTRTAGLPDRTTKIIVTHHPFDLPETTGKVKLVGRASQAMEAFSACGVDLLLAGHFHTSHAGDTSRGHDLPGYAALAVQAGTATSTRSRGEVNAFNVLRIGDKFISVERQTWNADARAFSLTETEQFRREGGCWIVC
jgi:3',5'-cyclic AMP phosphodiesterase CpdA